MGQSDNRNYQYPNAEVAFREEYEHILNLISPASSVVDFGCGDGSLLALIKEKKQPKRLLGVDISSSGVELAKKRGIDAQLGSIDVLQENLSAGAFDFAISNVTIQMVNYPERLLDEMARVAHWQIISFPNFGHFKNRLEHLFCGRMPKTMLYGYEWYSTGHIHQFSFKDFQELCAQKNMEIQQVICIGNGFLPMRLLAKVLPNLFGKVILCVLRKKQ